MAGFFGSSGDIIIKVGAEVGGAVSELGKLRSSVDQTATTGQKLRAGVQQAAVPAAAALTALGVAGLSAAKAAATAEANQARMNEQIQRSTGASDAAVASADKWIAALSSQTVIAKSELQPAMSTLIRSTGDMTEAQDLLVLSTDLAAATGKSLASTSTALAKAHAGSYGALKRLVPSISDAAIESGNWSKIQAELNQQVGGAAVAEAGTTEKQYEKLQLTMRGLQVAIGTALLPAFAALIGVLQPAADLAKQHADVVVILGGAIASLAAGVLVANAVLKIQAAIQSVLAAKTAIMAVATKAYAAAQWLLNVALDANPIGLVVVAVVALGAALVLAYRHSATFRNIVTDAFQAVIKYGWLLAGPLMPFILALKLAWEHADTLKRIAVAAFDAVKAAIQRVIDTVEDLIGRIPSIHFPSKPSWLPLSVPSTAALGPGALAAETGSGMVVNVTVTGAVDPESTAIQIRGILQRYDRRRGRRPLGGEENPTA